MSATPRPPADPRASASKRIAILKFALLAGFAVVILRLVQVQVLDAGRYQSIAKRQHEARVTIPAARGNIYDRNQTLLVSHTMFVSFGADPKLLGSSVTTVADRFSKVFGRSRDVYRARLHEPEKRFVWLERRVRPEYARRIDAPSFHGLVELKEPRRLYHFGQTGAQLIGFTDIDNRGIDGIELQMEAHLRGQDGSMMMQRDGLGRISPSMDYAVVDPVNGRSVELTIDVQYQSVAEEELRKGVQRTKAESGLVVMLDPMTGEVLAMANYPSVDPGNLAAASSGTLKNRVITDMFEPGSVFKIVTASAALERGVAKPESKYFAENGTYIVRYGREPRKITDFHPHGTLTFREAIEQSSNIVMAKVSDKIGAEALYLTARNYGFGVESGIELPGEVRGELKKPTTWSGATLNSMAYGYEVGVTPLQLAAAYGAIANGGTLMKPYVVKALIDENNEVIEETAPQSVRRVISKETARTLTSFLEGVVERGTGTGAKVPGMRIAGKTGTSRKHTGGSYQRGSYTASFAGFFPADQPKVVCVVMLDNAKEGGYTGGLASAPIFKAIAQRIHATNRQLTNPTEAPIAETSGRTVPDVRQVAVEAAKATLASYGFEVAMRGNGTMVSGQTPAPGKPLARGGVVTLTTIDGSAGVPAGYTIVPNLRGLSARRALASLTVQNLDASIAGSGVVVAQAPTAGSRVKAWTRVRLRCEPRSVALAGL
jgi:cell division protein FtsI/penicillin-binding protein 2